MTNSQYRALKWAVGEAEAWRGSLVGNPDPEPLKVFDATIAEAKAALKEVARMRKSEKTP